MLNYFASLYLGVLTGLMAVGQGALAQAADGRYSGVALAFSMAESDAVDGVVQPGGDLTALSFVLGNKWLHGNYTYGIELDADVGLRDATVQDVRCGVEGYYLCGPDATLRLRGLVGRPLGDAELFGAVGVGAMFGALAGAVDAAESGSAYGLSLGAGVNYPLRDDVRIRGEVTYDTFSHAGRFLVPEADWAMLSVRLMAVFNF